MTIDERLERLTERHEALTQTVELMVAEGKEREKHVDEILERMAGSMARLAHIAEIHEQRISDLEGGSR